MKSPAAKNRVPRKTIRERLAELGAFVGLGYIALHTADSSLQTRRLNSASMAAEQRVLSLNADRFSQKAIAEGSPDFSVRAKRLAKDLAAHKVNYPHFWASIIAEKAPEQSHSKIAANAELLNRLMEVAERAYPLNDELGSRDRIALLRLPYTLTKLRLDVLPGSAEKLKEEISRREKDLAQESALRYGEQKGVYFAHSAEVAALKEMFRFKVRFDAMSVPQRREVMDFLKAVHGK